MVFRHRDTYKVSDKVSLIKKETFVCIVWTYNSYHINILKYTIQCFIFGICFICVWGWVEVLHACVFICVQVHTHTYMCGGQMSTSNAFLYYSPPIYFFWDRDTNWTWNSVLVRVAGKWALGFTCLCLPGLGYTHVAMPGFCVGAGTWTYILILRQQALYQPGHLPNLLVFWDKV